SESCGSRARGCVPLQWRWRRSLLDTPRFDRSKDGLDGVEKLGLVERLGEVADHARVQGARTHALVGIGGDQQGRDVLARVQQGVVQLQAAHAGHLYVGNQDVGIRDV